MRELYWVGSSKEDLREFPEEVRSAFGFGLYLAQQGGKHPDAKPLKQFSRASVLEIAGRFDTDTYRAVYTVGLPSGVYVLHAFQKKSTHGIATPQHEIELVRRRLQREIRFDAALRDQEQ